MPVIFLQQSTAFFQSLLMWVSGGKLVGFWWKADRFPVENRHSGGKPVGFQCKAFLKKILLDFLRNSSSFHQANLDLNPGGFPVEFHWDSGRIPLGFQWNPSGNPIGVPVENAGILVELPPGFRLFFLLG